MVPDTMPMAGSMMVFWWCMGHNLENAHLVPF